jgi:hypothetical protein
VPTEQCPLSACQLVLPGSEPSGCEIIDPRRADWKTRTSVVLGVCVGDAVVVGLVGGSGQCPLIGPRAEPLRTARDVSALVAADAERLELVELAERSAPAPLCPAQGVEPALTVDEQAVVYCRSATNPNSPTATGERLSRPPRALPGDAG